MPNHSGKVSTDDNKSTLSVTDTDIETVVDFFKNYMTNDTPKKFKLNNPIILDSLVLSTAHGVDFTIGKYDCSNFYVLTSTITEPIANLRYNKSGSEDNYIYTKSETGDYYNNTGSAIVPTQNGLAFVYNNRQILFQNDNTILTRVYNSGWGNWFEIITDNNLEDKVSNYGFVNSMDLLNIIYPVGSVYMSFQPTSPDTLFGGTWEALDSGCFLRAGSGDELNVGGANTVTLQRANLPTDIDTTSIRGTYDNPNTHSDTISALKGTYFNISTNDKQTSATVSLAPHKDSEGNQPKQNITFTLNSTGAQQPISIIPPFQEVYMWRRTA